MANAKGALPFCCFAADPNALPNASLGCWAPQNFCLKGTEEYPIYGKMLNPNAVSGLYQDPDCAVCTHYVKAIPSFGFLCFVDFAGPVPVLCYPGPYNFFGFCCCRPTMGADGTIIWLTPCLPKSKCTLAMTVFISPCGCMNNWVDDDTYISSWCCFCGRVQRKIKQYAILDKSLDNCTSKLPWMKDSRDHPKPSGRPMER